MSGDDLEVVVPRCDDLELPGSDDVHVVEMSCDDLEVVVAIVVPIVVPGDILAYPSASSGQADSS
jgi:hypothetical protein